MNDSRLVEKWKHLAAGFRASAEDCRVNLGSKHPKTIKHHIKAEMLSVCAHELEREHDQSQAALDAVQPYLETVKGIMSRIGRAEVILSELAGGYWKSILNENDPTGHGDMGDRVIEYWAQCNAEGDTATGEKP